MKTNPNDQLINAFRAIEASISLKDGETLDAYREALSAAARTVAMQFLNDSAIAAGYDPEMEDMGQEDPDFRSYIDDAGADFVTLSCSRSHPWMSLCLRMTYTRGADGAFVFGGPEVVVPRRVYDPDPAAGESLAAFVGANIPAAEAVKSPTMAARKNLPAAAYAAPFFADADGDYSAGGTFVRSKSALPFHVRTATDVDSDDTVDIPRLRAALARFDQTDFARFGDAAARVKATAKSRLDRAAKALLPTARAAMAAGEAVLAKLPGCPTKADVDALATAHGSFVRSGIGERATEAYAALGRLAALAVAKRSVPATESADVQRQADETISTARALGCTGDEITTLARRLGAVRIGRVHDVVLGIV